MTLLHVLKPYTLHNVWLGGFPLGGDGSFTVNLSASWF